jgi:hypothetical protein
VLISKIKLILNMEAAKACLPLAGGAEITEKKIN